MQNTHLPSSEAAIVGRLIKPDHGDFSPEAARELLSLQFGDEDQARMRGLSLKAQDGTLTALEQAEVENYRRVGYWLGILWSKARLSLKRPARTPRMITALERLAWQRAGSRCEYCQLPQAVSPLPHAIDHIIARQHHGPTVEENLALACFFCNSYKGPNIAGRNPQTGRMVRLFHPRKDRWSRHFAWDGPVLVGRTITGRVTIALLEINRTEAVELRDYLLRESK